MYNRGWNVNRQRIKSVGYRFPGTRLLERCFGKNERFPREGVVSRDREEGGRGEKKKEREANRWRTVEIISGRDRRLQGEGEETRTRLQRDRSGVSEMEPLPASQDALRLELRLAAGARNDADADGDGLSSSSYPSPSSISLSYTLVHRCRPRAVVDLFLLLLLLIILLRFPLSHAPFSRETCSRSKLLARMTRERKFLARIHRKIGIASSFHEKTFMRNRTRMNNPIFSRIIRWKLQRHVRNLFDR